MATALAMRLGPPATARLAAKTLSAAPRWRHHDRATFTCRACRVCRGLGPRPRALSTSAPCRDDQQPPPSPRRVAVLGGGLTGLTTAYYITRYLPNAKVTLYEAADRLGGWVESTDVSAINPQDGEPLGSVHFERGPRTVPGKHNSPDYDDLILCDLVS